MVRRLPGRAALGAAIARRDIDLAPEDRIEPALARLIVEHNRREHVAMLGDRRRRHPELHHPIEQLVDAAGAVEQRVLAMKMEMNEVGHSHSIVDGGFDEMSYTTRLIPFTSLTIRDEIVASRSCGSFAQSAVMPSLLSTARIAIVYS